MALNKLKYNSLNVTPVANKAISFDSDPDALEATLSGGAMTFISKSTASSSSTISFTSGIDSTYKEYLFIFKDIHPATDASAFQFNLSIDSGSNYNVTKTTTNFRAYHREDGSDTGLDYRTSEDLAQSTSFQNLSNVEMGNGNDECCGGYLHLFNPSSTTFVKHFLANTNTYQKDDFSMNHNVAGYANTTSAVDAVQFKMSSGDIDAGTIKLFGVK